jgi:hypothetical protein
MQSAPEKRKTLEADPSGTQRLAEKAESLEDARRYKSARQKTEGWGRHNHAGTLNEWA